MNQTIITLEIGFGSLKLLAGYEMNGKVHILDSQSILISNLIQYGKISDAALVSSSIKKMIRLTEQNLSIKIDQINLVLPPIGFELAEGQKRTNVLSTSGVIALSDISNLYSYFKKDSFSKEHGLVMIVPKLFVLDGDQHFTHVPLNERSTNIVVHADIHFMMKELLTQVTMLFAGIGLKLKRTLVDAFAVTELLPLYETNLPASYLLLDHASNYTSMNLIDQGRFTASYGIDIGGEQLSAIISNQFSITYQEATRLKEFYGYDPRTNTLDGLVFQGKTTADSFISITQSQLNETIYNFYKVYAEEMSKVLTHYGPPESAIDVSDLPIYWIGGAIQLKGFQTLIQALYRQANHHYPNLKIIGGRSPNFLPLLGSIHVSQKYIAVVDDRSKPVPTIEREVKVKKAVSLYDDDL